MLNQYSWKVLLLVLATAFAGEPSRALSLVYQRPYKNIMFVPKNNKRRQRVLFLDEDENHQPFGEGEIDLTVDKSYNSKIKFDDSLDYEFTSPEAKELTGNDRFYEPIPRFRPYQNYAAFYQGRYGRPYAPSFAFEPYHIPIPFAPSRNSFYNPNPNGWKARSPRVVFPYATDSVNAIQTNSHAGPAGPESLDNVVFRDQNFGLGLNDIGTDEASLQDIGTGNADAFAERDVNDLRRAQFKEKKGLKPKKLLEKPMFIQTEGLRMKRIDFLYPNVTSTVLPEFKPITDEQMQRINEILKSMSTNRVQNRFRRGRLIEQKDPTRFETDNQLKFEPTGTFDDSDSEIEDLETEHTDRQDEKTCSQGGTCEFFFYCWMVGGLLEGSCGGLLKGCCHRVAKAGILGVQDSNSIEFAPKEGLSYGPVINDERKRNMEVFTAKT